jgi:hypothetical protein
VGELYRLLPSTLFTATTDVSTFVALALTAWRAPLTPRGEPRGK